MASTSPPAATENGALPEAVRSLTHDLRTPLTALKSCLDLLLREEAGTLNEDQKRFLGLAGRNIDRLDRMVGDMLVCSHPGDGGPVLQRGAVDLGPLLTESVRLHRLKAAENGLELDGSGIPATFTATVDPDLLNRILDNVLGNALKFTPAGGLVRVWLEEGVGSKRGLAARLARRFGIPLATFNLIVEDSGPGLSPAVQRRVFEPFNRGAGRGRGAGLGLSITRELAESHGGRVRLASLPGRGTTVWLKMPRNPQSESLLRGVTRLQKDLYDRPAGKVPPLVGVVDLRHTDCEGSEDLPCLKEFQAAEKGNNTRCRELIPGLWSAAVHDPVNWNRRWVLHAARQGRSLEATRWEFMEAEKHPRSGVAGNPGEQRETMVNQAASVPIIF